MSDPKRPKWRKHYFVTSETVASGVIADKPVEVIQLRIQRSQRKMDQIESGLDALMSDLQTALARFEQPIQLNVQFIEFIYTRVPTGQYGVTPIRVHTFCTSGFCSSTASGGNVYARTARQFSHTRTIFARTWNNHK